MVVNDESDARWVTTCVPPLTQIVRRNSSGARQPLVSNVDTALLVMGLDGDFNLRRLERYLAMVKPAGIWPVVVLTKRDLCDDVNQRLDALRDRLPRDIAVHAVDARAPATALELAPYFGADQTIVVLGSSGAGKSTLTNTLLGLDVQSTGDVREDDSRGRHTTTSRSLHRLPTGGCVIDTPGLRGLRPDIDEADLAKSFGDIECACRSIAAFAIAGIEMSPVARCARESPAIGSQLPEDVARDSPRHADTAAAARATFNLESSPPGRTETDEDEARQGGLVRLFSTVASRAWRQFVAVLPVSSPPTPTNCTPRRLSCTSSQTRGLLDVELPTLRSSTSYAAPKFKNPAGADHDQKFETTLFFAATVSALALGRRHRSPGNSAPARRRAGGGDADDSRWRRSKSSASVLRQQHHGPRAGCAGSLRPVFLAAAGGRDDLPPAVLLLLPARVPILLLTLDRQAVGGATAATIATPSTPGQPPQSRERPIADSRVEAALRVIELLRL